MPAMNTRRRIDPSQSTPEAGEPPLSELLDDPVLHMLMARDHVERAELEDVIAYAQRRLGITKVPPDILFADCA
jgi:hypothetical protein